jgi:diguanylate cyclase (GGDEF)-like protein/PAS domain S-box-containing protein
MSNAIEPPHDNDQVSSHDVVDGLGSDIDKMDTPSLTEVFALLKDHMVVGVDLHTHRFLYINAALQSMLGYTEAELLAMNVWDVFEEPYKTQVKTSVEEGLQTLGQVNSTVLKATRKPGDSIWLEAYVTSVPYRGKIARIANYINVTEAITLKERMDQQLASFYSALDAMPTPVVISKETFQYANPAAVAWSGYSQAELAQRQIWDLIVVTDDLRQRMQKNMERHLRGESFLGEYPRIEVRLKGGSPKWVHIVTRTLWHHNSWVDLMILTDITDSVITEQRMARERERYRELSELDPLTQIYNRRLFDNQLADMIQDAGAQHRQLTLVMIDIDHFKTVNDEFGHETGDYVLQELAKVVLADLRPTDIFARYGGEEFMAIIPDIISTNVKALAERLRLRIACHDFKIGRQITVSMGLTELKPDDTTTRMVHRVDDALYDAKHGGRNRIVVG